MAKVHHVLKPRDFSAKVGRWSLQGTVDWREWDGEFVVRVDDTAATYLLSTLAGETLRVLREGPAHVDEISARVFADVEPRSPITASLVATFGEAASDTQVLLEVLAELESLGLARADFN